MQDMFNDKGIGGQAKRSIVERIDQVDWNFSIIKNSDPTEHIHSYPAKFISEIPRNLIEILDFPEGTAILDPFCGSGTTLVESQKKGIPSIGIDLNPIACLISKVKTRGLFNNFEKRLSEVINEARITNVPIKDIPNVNHWFMQEIQVAINQLQHVIISMPSEIEKDFFSLVLSSIIVRISNQESDTRYAAVLKKTTYDSVFDQFSLASKKIFSALDRRIYSLTKTTIINDDILKVTKERIEKPIGLVITSPPYPNAYEYWLYHKYRMYWLGYDPQKVKDSEIGARAHFFGKKNHNERDFFFQMDKTFNLINQVLVKSGYICIVVGRSKIHGKIVDNSEIISEVANNYPLQLYRKFERTIQANRKSFNLSHANIKTESILIFKKVGQ
jgi:DNA modification methylase